MRMFHLYAAATLSVLLVGCASTGSSQLARSVQNDGSTQIWYSVGGSGASHIDERSTLMKAADRCAARGYDGVRVSDGDTARYCREDGGYAGCTRWVIVKQYQCANMTASTSP